MPEKNLKKICFVSIHDSINKNNNLFESTEHPLGDNLLKPFSEIEKKAFSDGYQFASCEKIPMEEADAIVFLESPIGKSVVGKSISTIKNLKKPKYLYIFECPLLLPKSWKSSTHVLFDRVFTYDHRLWDGKKYFPLCIPYSMEREQQKIEKKGFLCLVASNKVIVKQHSGYDTRRELINYFLDKKTSDFSLYGHGWDFYFRKSRVLTRIFSKIGITLPALNKISTKIPFYRGSISQKMQTIGKYKFVFCNENFSHPGYITEKIFDAMWAGSVPVYSGPPNIDFYIPKTCYVSIDHFKTIEELVNFLRHMPESKYQEYLTHIKNYLNSEMCSQFSSSAYYESLHHALELDLKN